MSGVAATRDSLDTDQIPRAQNPWGRRRLTMTNATVRGAPYAVAAYALGVVAAHPWMDRWGSTAAERTLGLAGDELVPDAAQQTHAITIDAPPEAVWPWLVQMGQDRAGFYSHDRLERLVGADIRNADEIHPEWQHLAVGDLVRTYRSMPRFEPLGWLVATIEPPRLLVVHEPERGGIISSSWAFVLERGNERTRLLSRWRFRRRGAAHTAFKWLVFDPAHFIMETGVLHGLKTRVERRTSMMPPPDVDALAAAQVDGRSASTRAGVSLEVPSEGAIGGVR
jgi:hypothetical protein